MHGAILYQNYQTCAVGLPGDIRLVVAEPLILCTPFHLCKCQVYKSVMGWVTIARSIPVNCSACSIYFVDSVCTSEQLETLKAMISQHVDLFELDGSPLQLRYNTLVIVLQLKKHPCRTQVVQRKTVHPADGVSGCCQAFL